MAYGGIVGQQQNIDAFTKEETYSSETQAKYGALINNPNKAFDVLSKAALFYPPSGKPKYQEVTINLSTASVGDIIQLPENNMMTDYLVVHIGNPSTRLYDTSCNGVWLLRKDIAENRVWNDELSNILENSTIQSYLNNTWINRYGINIINTIKQVKIPYRQNGGLNGTDRTGTNGLSCKIFLLSIQELGFLPDQNDHFPNDGIKLDYFLSGDDSSANQKRIAKLNNIASGWWTRSPETSNTGRVFHVYSNGRIPSERASDSSGIRPAFIMPTTFQATYYVDNSGTVHDAQEYETAGTTTDVQGNPISIGAQIATGSYVGTGAYGEDNPNTLAFDFKPEIVLISATVAGYWPLFGISALTSSYISSAYAVIGESDAISGNMWAKFDDASNTLSWYHASNALGQGNQSSRVYHYVALG